MASNVFRRTLLRAACLIAILLIAAAPPAEARTTKDKTAALTEGRYDERYRNQFHYSAAKNWINDPNGLFYDSVSQRYNLYYQYNPEGSTWGNMSWGHAVSRDLINWTEMGVAIPMMEHQGWEDFTYTNTVGALREYGEVHYLGKPTTDWNADNPDQKKAIFSGCVVVDHDNRSGLGADAVLAFYTTEYQIATRRNDGADGGMGTWIGMSDIQEQHLAYSSDGGVTFTPYSADGDTEHPKPILPTAMNKGGDAANFRDPNIAYDPDADLYCMTLVSDQQVLIYTSKNLLDWSYVSNIERQSDVGDGVWECPSLIPLAPDGTDTMKWVLCVSVQNGAHATGSGMNYYIGSLDASGAWKPDSSQTMLHPLDVDSGEDFYAAAPFSNLQDGRTIMLGWESNWSYNAEARTAPWYGNMTLPRQLRLVRDAGAPDGYALENMVVDEIENNQRPNVIAAPDRDFMVSGSQRKLEQTGSCYKISATFSWDQMTKPGSVGFRLRISDDERYHMVVGYDLRSSRFFVQRLSTGEPDMGDPRDHMNAVVNAADAITITVYVDETSIEAFANDGAQSITQNFFMRPEYIGEQATDGIGVYADDGSTHVSNLQMYPITSAWSGVGHLRIRHLDARGAPLMDDQLESGRVGQRYTYAPARIPGYTVSSISGEEQLNKSHLFTARDQTVTYCYEPAKTSIEIKDTTLVAGPAASWSPADNFIAATDAQGNPLDLSDLEVDGSANPAVPGVYDVVYSYADSTGATASRTAHVNVVASRAAISTRDLTLDVVCGGAWSPADSFVSACDAMGAPLGLDDLEVDGDVDTTRPGVYRIVYSFTDIAGNEIVQRASVTMRALAPDRGDHGAGTGDASDRVPATGDRAAPWLAGAELMAIMGASALLIGAVRLAKTA